MPNLLRHAVAIGLAQRDQSQRGGLWWAIARLAERQHGVVAREQLLAIGLTSSTIGRWVASGRLYMLHRGVYAVGHSAVTLEGRFLAAVLAAGPRAVLSHFSAGALWRILEWEERLPEVTLLGCGAASYPGLRLHRTTILDPRDARTHDNIRVTSPVRTIFDLASLLPYKGLRRAVRQAASLHLLNDVDLVEGQRRLGGRRGAARIRRILAEGPAPTRSALEDVVLELIRSAGLEPPDVNVPLFIDGRRVVPDFRWPERHLVIEADGAAWHDHRLAREDDVERQALLEAQGDRVLRVTWEQALARRTQSISRIRAAAG